MALRGTHDAQTWRGLSQQPPRKGLCRPRRPTAMALRGMALHSGFLLDVAARCGLDACAGLDIPEGLSPVAAVRRRKAPQGVVIALQAFCLT